MLRRWMVSILAISDIFQFSFTVYAFKKYGPEKSKRNLVFMETNLGKMLLTESWCAWYYMHCSPFTFFWSFSTKKPWQQLNTLISPHQMITVTETILSIGAGFSNKFFHSEHKASVPPHTKGNNKGRKTSKRSLYSSETNLWSIFTFTLLKTMVNLDF